MKKRFLAAVMVAIMAVTAGCGDKPVDSIAPGTAPASVEADKEKEIVSSTSDETTVENDGALAGLEAFEDVEVEKNLFSVEITVPADFLGEITQEELDAEASENGYKSATLNADGSATYVMTKAQHEKLLEAIRESIAESIDELIADETFIYTSIKPNDNYSEFVVTVATEELGFMDSMGVLSFYMLGGMYGVFAGEEIDNVHVKIVSDVTGAVLADGNSSEMEE